MKQLTSMLACLYSVTALRSAINQEAEQVGAGSDPGKTHPLDLPQLSSPEDVNAGEYLTSG